MRSTWGFSIAGRLLFGRGALQRGCEQLPAVVDSPLCKVLIITDENLCQCGHGDRLMTALAAVTQHVTLCTAGAAEPCVDDLLACVQAAHACQPNVIVGLGGGSNLDLAKLTATVLAHGGKPHDYFGFDRVPGRIVPVAAVPTTAGTGSEVSHSAVLTDPQAGVKVSTLSQYLRPAIAIVDPELTDTCPPKVTADSGIDALVHAVEALSARRFDELASAPSEARAYEGAHPLGKMLAADAIRLVGLSLEKVVEHPNSHGDRDSLALAATYAGMAFSNCGVALVHALEYPLGALVHCSHGAGNGTLLPYVMRFNLSARETETAQIGQLLGVVDTNQPIAQQAIRTVDAITGLRQRIGIPHQLREYGLDRKELPQLAEKTSQIQRLMSLNPRQASVADLLNILEEAY